MKDSSNLGPDAERADRVRAFLWILCGRAGPARARTVRNDKPPATGRAAGGWRRAHDRDRTGDLILTKDVLCRLSYVSDLHLRPVHMTAIHNGHCGPTERETGLEPATSSLEG